MNTSLTEQPPQNQDSFEIIQDLESLGYKEALLFDLRDKGSSFIIETDQAMFQFTRAFNTCPKNREPRDDFEGLDGQRGFKLFQEGDVENYFSSDLEVFCPIKKRIFNVFEEAESLLPMVVGSNGVEKPWWEITEAEMTLLKIKNTIADFAKKASGQGVPLRGYNNVILTPGSYLKGIVGDDIGVVDLKNLGIQSSELYKISEESTKNPEGDQELMNRGNRSIHGPVIEKKGKRKDFGIVKRIWIRDEELEQSLLSNSKNEKMITGS